MNQILRYNEHRHQSIEYYVTKISQPWIEYYDTMSTCAINRILWQRPSIEYNDTTSTCAMNFGTTTASRHEWNIMIQRAQTRWIKYYATTSTGATCTINRIFWDNEHHNNGCSIFNTCVIPILCCNEHMCNESEYYETLNTSAINRILW